MTVEIKLPIFLDNQATTQIDPRVLDEMLKYYAFPCNPHSKSHSYGWSAEAAVENAREQVASLINAHPKDIIFTSGATESNNLAIKGAVNFYRSEQKNHVITVVTEHKCVLDTCRHLEDEGVEVTYLPVKNNGLIDLDVLKNAITDKTILVSVMMVNNEIGVIQPIVEIGKICRERNVIFHTDAAQAFGKIPINVDEMNVSFMSISSHKIYGPMGIGALYVRRKNPRVRIKPIINGGGQERGMRSGTIATQLAVGFGKAAAIAAEVMEEDNKRIKKLRNILYNKIKSEIHDIVLNGDEESRIPGNLNISFPYVEGESIIMAIKDIAVSSGSACTSASLEPSYVLHALGLDVDLSHSSIRFGIGRFNTEAEINYAADLIVAKLKKLREMSPLWEMVQEGIDLKSINWAAH
jgi:cysteine desulfurase